MPSISLFLISPNAFVCDLLRQNLGQSPDVLCAGTWQSLAGAEDAIACVRPDIVVVDTVLCGPAAPATIAGCLASHPGLRVLLWYDDEGLDAAVDCLAAGAVGAISKRCSLDVFLASVRAAVAGEAILAGDLQTQLVERYRDLSQSKRRPAGLSDREAQMLDLIVQGMTNQQIADALGVSIQTVKNSLSRLFFRLGVVNRLQAAAWWRDHLTQI